MITKINNYSFKSFKNYTGPSTPFAEKNIVFGYNGKGKSAISLGILKEYLASKSTSESTYRLFNSDYVNSSLLLNSNDTHVIKGIKATFGSKDVEIESKITKLKEGLIDTSQIETSLFLLKNKLEARCNEILESKKGSLKINKKKLTEDVDAYFSQYQSDLDKALKITNEANLKSVGDVSSLEKTIDSTRSYIPLPIVYMSNEEINETKRILENTYNNETIPSKEVIDWLNEGITLHKKDNSTTCKFCGSPISLSKIKSKIENYLKNKKEQDLLSLSAINDKALRTINLDIETNKKLYTSLVNKDETPFKDIYNYFINLKSLDKLIEKKLMAMDNAVLFDEKSIINSQEACKKSLDKISEMQNKRILELQTIINKSNDIGKGLIAYEILHDSLTNSLKSEITEKTATLILQRKTNEETNKTIDMLIKSKSSTADFANYITELLTDLEIDIKLDLVGNDYILLSKNDNQNLSIGDISEGERNLLSLLFFFFEMFNDNKQKDFKSEIQLIIVDDPISSIDDINKMFVLSLVKKIIELPSTQVFVFTHVWDDFVELCYGKNDENRFHFYEVIKNKSGSSLISTKAKETPYEHDFLEILHFSKETDTSNMSDCEMYHYPNVMRKVLEKFLSFKVRNSSPTSGNINNIYIALCNGNPTAKDVIEMGALLDVCNVYSHQTIRSPEEILRASKYLMGKIKSADQIHFNKMLCIDSVKETN